MIHKTVTILDDEQSKNILGHITDTLDTDPEIPEAVLAHFDGPVTAISADVDLTKLFNSDGDYVCPDDSRNCEAGHIVEAHTGIDDIYAIRSTTDGRIAITHGTDDVALDP